ncbi:MAG: ABC transporter permease [Wenzhouxiangellaceae bacterium]
MILDSLQRLGAILFKELRQLRRDRPTFGMIVGLPLLQIILFGYAINMDVRHMDAAVLDLADNQQSRYWLDAAEASQLINIKHRAASAAELDTLLRRGEVSVGIEIPTDFNRRTLDRQFQRTARPSGQILIDNTQPGLDAVAGQLARIPVQQRIDNRVHSSAFAVQQLFNPERRTAVQIVPALIGVILNLSMVLFTAIAIVRERERGNLEFLITTPVRSAELMLGKIIPYILIGLIQVTLILAVAVYLFDVVVAGSVLQLYFAAALFIAATLALGLVISTLAKTQFQAMQLTVFTFLPSILLSGFMFPFQGMPRFAQQLAEFLPLTHFVRLLRGIVLRGVDIREMPQATWALTSFAVVLILLAIVRFRKRLD